MSSNLSPDLTIALPEELGNRTAILDGEIVCLNTHGKAEFGDLLFRRREPRFIAFDLLSSRGEDLRYMSLIDRKRRLRALIRPHGERLLYCDHVEHNGEALFDLACEHDLEGIVAKRKSDSYLSETPNSWLKVRNRNYSQWVGREQLFERERDSDTKFHGWECCTSICASWGNMAKSVKWVEDQNLSPNFSNPCSSFTRSEVLRLPL